MASPNGGTPVEPGIISRLATGVRFAISGLSPDRFFGPGQPLPPAAQDEAHGRAFDYDTNINITTRPRSNEPIDFKTLRMLADNYDLVRIAIETRKDQMGRLRWTVQRQDNGKQDATAKDIEAFLRKPDREHDFLDWSRMLYEDMLVIDAPTVYVRRTKGGDVYALEQIDGATIKRNLDERGRTPQAPDPAYQQIIKGLPATDYSLDELLYKPRNPRIHKIYGFSPVEQLILIVNIGLRREAHQLAFYTAGNVPEMLMGAPKEWTPDQIKTFQKYWDLVMQGDLEARRQLRFVPGDLKPLVLRPEASLFDAFDEWLARVICYCFSIPPNAFVKQQNRATAESAQEVALEEGLAPLMEWQVRFMNLLIEMGWRSTAYEFVWIEEQAIDPVQQAQIDVAYAGGPTGQGVMIRTVQEIRDDHNWGPAPQELIAANTPQPSPNLNPNPHPKDDDAPGPIPPNDDSETEKSVSGVMRKRRGQRRWHGY